MLPVQPNLYIYDFNHHRLKPHNPESFYFFGSGSTGNSVYLKASKLLIDLGFGFKKYKDTDPLFFYKVKYVLLTHEHGDHLNPATLHKLLTMYPHLKFIISKRMFNVIVSDKYTNRFNKNLKRGQALQAEIKTKFKNKFIIIDSNVEPINTENAQIIPHFVTHADIVNVAYEINTPIHHVLYSSDLDHVFALQNSISASLSLPLEFDSAHNPKRLNHPFDLVFLEANYDEDILNAYLQDHPDDPHAKGNGRHISEQETWKYLRYAMTENGRFIPLHASSAFGTLIQKLD